MTALAVERPPAIWAGRVIVRAAGRVALHVAVVGAPVPSAVMFTVPVECHPDADSAPGVRPWTGPVEENRLCVPCLRVLRGEPEPEPVRTVSAGAAVALLEPASDRQGRRLWAVSELPSYTAPSLPAEHAARPIRWSEWGTAPKLSHYSSACDWCGDAGPCLMADGRQGNPLAKDNPLGWFVAYRCSYCQEMSVYEQTGTADLSLIAHSKPKSPKGARA